jgi:hypothetical protein
MVSYGAEREQARREKPESEKLTHAAARYHRPSHSPGKNCGNCKNFIDAKPPRCRGVQRPILPVDVCEVKYERKD